ncbi:MAG: hemerythrin domain-containing protein [Actinomycetota bacterium]
MDAVTLLTADHNRVRGLFARFKEAQEAEDTAAMSELAAQCFTELEVHTGIEEEIFYPRVKETDEEIAELVDEGLQEHHVVDVLMEEMKALEPGSDEWVAKFTVLMENVEHHAEEEEAEMFPPLRSKLGADVLEPLADELEAGKKQRGAPIVADKIDLTKEQLMELAREQEIPGRSKMDHDELAATVAPTS